MPEYTNNLKLFKYNTETDGKEVFSINEAMNHNWDILDKQPGTLKANQITNCLLEVPQRVNVELNNTTLTLKAGSVVIVPYGTSAPTMEIGDTLNGNEIVDISWDGEKLFYYVKSNSDLSAHNSYNSYRLVLMTNDGYGLTDMPTTVTFSQDSAPTEFASGYALWYDTESNIVKYTNNQGSSWTEYYSLPFALMNPYYESIKNIFNGFGFIGSTIWVDKGVKGLAPDGRNPDGSLKNYEITVENIITRQTNFNGQIYLQLQYNNMLALSTTNTLFFNYDDSFDDLSTLVYFDSVNNIVWTKTNNVWAKTPRIIINIIKVEDLKVTSFEPAKQSFHALDYNNTEFIANQAMPGSNYIDLSLPASGGKLVALADGYITVSKRTTGGGQFLSLVNEQNGLRIEYMSYYNNDLAQVYIPVSKNDIITVIYNVGGRTSTCRFIYANGSL